MVKQKSIYWSVIVPCYNEDKRVDNLITILKYLNRLDKTWELIAVNDGSTDNTLAKLEKLNKNANFKIISYKKNRGKGYAVKTGMLKAKGKFRLFLDVDLSTPIGEMEKFSRLVNQYNVVIGTRKLKGSKVLEHQPILREYMGMAFTLLSQIILNIKVSDFTCGFKCFDSRASQMIFENTKIFRWGFDSETMYLAKKYGFSLKEVPVVWKNSELTKVRFPGDIVDSLWELLTIRYFDWVIKSY